MSKNQVIDYMQAVIDFEKSYGRKTENTDIPLKSSSTPDGWVDYLAASQAYLRLQNEDDSDVIHVGKR